MERDTHHPAELQVGYCCESFIVPVKLFVVACFLGTHCTILQRSHSVFVRAGTPGPLLGYFDFCPGYFVYRLY